VPVKVPKDVVFPGGVVRAMGDRLMKVIVDPDPPNREKVMGGSDWPAFNKVLLETVLATIATTSSDTDAASNHSGCWWS
jgi:hypothetical protein